jgi:hypothetical protein
VEVPERVRSEQGSAGAEEHPATTQR